MKYQHPNPDSICAGSRILVFDHKLYKNDKLTPLSMTMKPATVVRRYGCRSPFSGYIYPDVVDVVFDHDGRESKAHFTEMVTDL